MAYNFRGKTALVTGATSGIGRAIALDLAAHGAYVITCGRDVRRGEGVVEKIRSDGGKADFIAATLSDEASARSLARRGLELGNGRVDVLVNNAGVSPLGPTHKMNEADFDVTYGLNVKVPFFLVAELTPAMVSAGQGAIVNILSQVGQFGMVQAALFGSSKAALLLLTKAWAAEYGPSGVRVNAVSPGFTRTEGTAPLGAVLDQLASTIPYGQVGMPEDIASAVTYLASDAARFVHGAILSVDGGRTAI